MAAVYEYEVSLRVSYKQAERLTATGAIVTDGSSITAKLTMTDSHRASTERK